MANFEDSLVELLSELRLPQTIESPAADATLTAVSQSFDRFWKTTDGAKFIKRNTYEERNAEIIAIALASGARDMITQAAARWGSRERGDSRLEAADSAWLEPVIVHLPDKDEWVSDKAIAALRDVMARARLVSVISCVAYVWICLRCSRDGSDEHRVTDKRGQNGNRRATSSTEVAKRFPSLRSGHPKHSGYQASGVALAAMAGKS